MGNAGGKIDEDVEENAEQEKVEKKSKDKGKAKDIQATNATNDTKDSKEAKEGKETKDKKLTKAQKEELKTSVAGIVDLPSTGMDRYRTQRLFDVMFGVVYGYTCDVCEKSIPKPDPRMHCWECDYDVCMKCHPKAPPHHHSLFTLETEYTEDLREKVPGASCAACLRNAFVYYKARPCMAWKKDGKEFTWATYGEIYDWFSRFGAGLRLLYTPRQFIGILSENRIEYFIFDWACIMHSFVSVPIHSDFSIEDIGHIISQTNLSAIVVSPKFLDKLIAALAIAPLQKTLLVIVITNDASLIESARAACESATFDTFDNICEINKNKVPFTPTMHNELITVVYTSGSTGKPKGVMFSDKAWKYDLADPRRLKNLPREHVVMSYMPTSHITDRVTVGLTICGGGRAAISGPDVSALFADLPIIRPSTFSAPPAIWIKMYKDYKDVLAKALAALPEENPEVVRKRVIAEFSKILGGRTEALSTGGAQTPPYIFTFVKECFETILGEGYGITEAGGLTSESTIYPGVDVKLVDVPELGYTNEDKPYPRGEIVVKKDLMFMGYFNDPERTNEVLKDGWYHTGDIGMMVGSKLKVIDRVASVFKLVQGEFVSPEKIEKVLHQSPFVQQVFVTAVATQFRVVAVVVPRPDAVAKFAEKYKLECNTEEICNNPIFNSEVRANLAELGIADRMKYYEVPCAVYLEHEPFSPDNLKLTRTLKMRRNYLRQFYEPIVTKLYESVEQSNSKNRIQELLMGEWNRMQGNSESSTDPNLVLQGLSSFGAVHLSQFLSHNLGVPIAPQVFYDEDPTKAIVHLLGDAKPLPTVDWQAELQLPEIATPADPSTLPNLATASSILITGATGFLGVFLLREILEQFTSARVYCLIRGDMERMEKVMKESFTWKPEYSTRIQIVNGDLAKPKLGIEDQMFEELTQNIDVIFHCGAAVNAVAPYNMLKKANVDATKEIIKFALTHKMKFLFHISSLSILDVHDGNGKIDEIPMKALCKKLNNSSGYSQSKFVSDMLVQQAHDKFSLPTLIFRPATICSDSNSGFSNIRDSVFLIMAGIAKLEKAPRYACFFDMCPVDAVAQAIVNISKNMDVKWEGKQLVYHMINIKGSVSLHQIIRALEFCGRKIKTLEYEDWIEVIRKSPNLPLYALLPNISFSMGGLSFVDSKYSTSAWTPQVDCLPVTEDMLVKSIQWMEENAIL